MSRRIALAAALALCVACLVSPAIAASRGPSTQQERDKTVQLVKLLETTPWTDEAKQARTWLMTFLGGVPDITVKRCLSLLGTAAERTGIPPELQDQQMFSGAGYMLQHPERGAGSTDTFYASVAGTLASYTAWRGHGLDAVPRLDQLLKMQQSGELVAHVRAQGRNCR